MSKIHSVGIIGAGVSGSVVALQLAAHGIDNILFEKEQTVVNGPPFCHLHAGGNLYPDISDQQCRLLMRQSIEMGKMFPQSIDERPTFISVPKTEKYEFTQIKERLDMLVSYYKKLIKEDASNQILGNPDEYYKIYSREDLEELAKQEIVKVPCTSDQWMINTANLIDIDKLKTPVLLVQEYGWNLFRLGAQAQLAIDKSKDCTLKLDTEIKSVKDVRDFGLNYNWEICTEKETFKVKYLVNSSGFRTGVIDDSLGVKSERLIEFKAAYVAKWQPINGLLPELIFHGERGTPHGMAQLTPYCSDYYQIHGMTEDITLFKNGLVKSSDKTSQPKFESDIASKIEKGWSVIDTNERTEKSINFISNFVPTFNNATVGGPPLYGAQQIPGKDPDLRVGEVCFASKFYARSEIVKASSALTVANQIIENLIAQSVINPLEFISNENPLVKKVSLDQINYLASQFAELRGYPSAMSHLLIKKVHV